MKRILTIAGSDSSGGAGIQADLKTFHQFGCYGMSAITAVTAQNTLGVHAVQNIKPRLVAAQIKAVVGDIGVDALKTGMLATAGIVRAVARTLRKIGAPNLVVDPVMSSTGGVSLLSAEARQALIDELFPLALLVTPNLAEAAMLTGIEVRTVQDMNKAARMIHAKGPENVLVKGGHLAGAAVDVLFDGHDFTEFAAERIDAKNTHGTGCAYASAIAAGLALEQEPRKAIAAAKSFITRAIRDGLSFGKGAGPVSHFTRAHDL